MNSHELKKLQQPLKHRYAEEPQAAVAKLHAQGNVDFERLACLVSSEKTAEAGIVSGLHPSAGGDGSLACSGDMLLQSLVACSGVTFAAVATAMELKILSARVEAIGEMDFRGTLAVEREVPVGLTSIELVFTVDSDEPPEKIEKLVQLTERYCVVLQTLKQGVEVSRRLASGQ